MQMQRCKFTAASCSASIYADDAQVSTRVGNSCRLIYDPHSFHLNVHIIEVPSSLPSAIPAGVVLQVDGEARGADRLRGRQRNLPQADVSAACLLPPLQRCFHRDQEEEVSGRAPPLDAAGQRCV